MVDIAARILALKHDVTKAQQLRATAAGSLEVAEQQLADVEARITALGITPANADVEVAALEAQLDTLVTDLERKVAAEVATYTQIITAAKAVYQTEGKAS